MNINVETIAVCKKERAANILPKSNVGGIEDVNFLLTNLARMHLDE